MMSTGHLPSGSARFTRSWTAQASGNRQTQASGRKPPVRLRREGPAAAPGVWRSSLTVNTDAPPLTGPAMDKIREQARRDEKRRRATGGLGEDHRGVYPGQRAAAADVRLLTRAREPLDDLAGRCR